MRTIVAAFVLAGTGAWLVPASAQAQPDGQQSFSWTSAPTCLDEPTASAAFEALLGESWQDPEVTVAVELAAADDGFTLLVRTSRGSETAERSLHDPSCEALGEAAILVVALAIRPDLELGPGDRELLDRVLNPVLEEPEPPGLESSPEPPPVEPPPVEPPPVDPPAPEGDSTPPPVFAAMTLRGGVGWGMLPTLEGGPSAGAAVVFRHARVEVGGRGWFGPAATAPGAATVSISGWAVGVRGGPSWSVRDVRLPLMLGTEVGQLVGRPEGLRDPKIQRPTWWAFSVSWGAVYSPWERLGLTAMVEGFVSVTRPSFTVEGYSQDVHIPRRGGIRALFGVEARFGQ